MIDTYLLFGCLYAASIFADDWGKFDKWTWITAVVILFTWPASFIYQQMDHGND